MSYGLVTRAINAPIGVTQANRFGQVRAYIPLSQFFLQQGGSPLQADGKGKVLTGKTEPQAEPKEPKKKKNGKNGNGKAKSEELTEGKQCSFCRKPATSSEGDIPCCDDHKKLGQRAMRKKKARAEAQKGNPIALLLSEATKKYPDVGGWRLLGIDDEVETCENCGKKGLKRTMVIEPINDPGALIHVGTTCGEILTGRPGPWLMRRAIQVQQEKEKATGDARRSRTIQGVVKSGMSWKLLQRLFGRYMKGLIKGDLVLTDGQKKGIRDNLTAILRTSGLGVDDIKAYHGERFKGAELKALDKFYKIASGMSEERPERCGSVAVSLVPKKKKKKVETVKTEVTGFTVFKSGASGPSAGMTGSGNIPAVALPIGAPDGGWGAIDAPGRKGKKRKKKGDLAKGIDYLLRQVW